MKFNLYLASFHNNHSVATNLSMLINAFIRPLLFLLFFLLWNDGKYPVSFDGMSFMLYSAKEWGGNLNASRQVRPSSSVG